MVRDRDSASPHVRVTSVRVLSGLLVLTGILSVPAALFGLAQLVETAYAQMIGPPQGIDFLTYYGGGLLLLTQPTDLYQPDAGAALQWRLSGERSVYLQFWNPPHTALFVAPLALLPHNLAYLTWGAVNIASFASAAYLLAPRPLGRESWLLWMVGTLLFLPVQLALVLGQTSVLMLLGFSVFARFLERQRPWTTIVGLVLWTWKPQMLPACLLALALSRRWRELGLLVAVPVALSAVVILLTGPQAILDYLKLSSLKSAQVFSRADSPGQTLLGLSQSLFGVGPASTVLAGFGAAVVGLLVGGLWWGGPRRDARRYLQLAVLPVAAVLMAPHALAYMLAGWLASAWLLLRFANEAPAERPAIFLLVIVGWWAGNLAVLTEWSGGVEWGAIGGLLSLAIMAWLYRQAPSSEGADVATRITRAPDAHEQWPT